MPRRGGALVGDPAFGAGHRRRRPRVGDADRAVADPGRHDDRAAGLRRHGEPGRSSERIDVKGKIAVQLIVPQGHMVFERGAVDDRSARTSSSAAPSAVFNLVRLPGNELVARLRQLRQPVLQHRRPRRRVPGKVLDKRRRRACADKLRARLSSGPKSRTGLKAENAVAVVPGDRSDEVILIDAHADAWFDGAGDNADGLAVMVALARHFAKPAEPAGSARWCSSPAPAITRPASTARAASSPPTRTWRRRR